VSTIEDALQQHFRQERIGGHGDNPDSMYKCEKCHVKVPAKKRCLIERPPAVLCIQVSMLLNFVFSVVKRRSKLERSTISGGRFYELDRLDLT
jgi:ubiquitin C-terminal hydrolase